MLSQQKKKKAEGEKKGKHRCWEKSSKLLLLISAEKLVEPIRTERGSQGGPATLPACSCSPSCVWATALSMNSPLLAPGHHPQQGHSLCSHVLLGKAMDVFPGSLSTQNNCKWLKEMNYRIWRRTRTIFKDYNVKGTTCKDRLYNKTKDNAYMPITT